MKTLIYNMMAIAALCAMTLSVNAQNTKRISYSRYYAEQLFTNVKNVTISSSVSEELNAQAKELAEICKFNPKKDALAYKDPEYAESMEAISDELEKDVKFRPDQSLVNEMDSRMALEEITSELKNQVKYTPSESIVNSEYESSAVFSEILKELAKDAQFHPEKID